MGGKKRYMVICIVIVLLIFAVFLVLLISIPARPTSLLRPVDVELYKQDCSAWFDEWCITHPGESCPTEYPEHVVVIDGKENIFRCIDILGDRKCGGVR